MKKDIYETSPSNKWDFTLETICNIINAEIPPEWSEFRHHPIKRFALQSVKHLSGRDSILFDTTNPEKDLPAKVNYIKSGGFLITPFTYLDEDNVELPKINLEDANKAWIQLGKYIKQTLVMPTIGITGSVGKTTTTMMAQCVFNEKYKVFVSGENGQNVNTPKGVVTQLIKRYSSEYDFHIQECGGGRPGLVEGLAQIIDADVFGITKIDQFHHIDYYGTAECIIKDKTCFDRLAKENAVGVINLDDETLSNFPFKSKTISYGITNTSADYVARNIVHNGLYLEFDVDNHTELVHIKIEIPGNHNVYNALMVFAFAKIYGFSDEEIQRGFMKYSSGSIRQALREVSGRNMYIDCFNVCSASIKSCCETLQNFQINAGNRKIAILGGENALGEHSHAVNYATGQCLGAYDIDEFIFVGPKEPATPITLNRVGNGKSVYEGAKTVIDESKIVFFDDFKQLADKLAQETRPGDAILLKGGLRLPLFAGIDIAFGTSYTVHNPNLKRLIVQEHDFSGEYFHYIQGVNILNVTNIGAQMKIPDTLKKKPVSRLNEDLFANCSTLTDITFGESLKIIGARCFFQCTGLSKIVLPENVIHIENESFAQCENLDCIEMLGIQQIEEKAFSGCKKLKKIILSEKCLTIEPDAFSNCSKLKIIAPKDSYAYQYAVENKIAVSHKHLTLLNGIFG